MIIRLVFGFRFNDVGNGDRIFFLRVDLCFYFGRINYLFCDCGNIWREILIFYLLILVDMNILEGRMWEVV